MRKIIVSEFMTVDGKRKDPGGNEKSNYRGWTLPYPNEEIGKFKFDELLKQQPEQDILVFGSNELVRTLIQRRLIDEYRLLVYPVILGTSKKLSKNGVTTTLKLNEAKTLSNGIILLSYQLDNKEMTEEQDEY